MVYISNLLYVFYKSNKTLKWAMSSMIGKYETTPYYLQNKYVLNNKTQLGLYKRT